MIRLFYRTDSLESAELASRQLRRAGVSDWHFHVLSTDANGLHRRHLNGGTIWRKRDILRSGERGAMLGLCIGVLLALLMILTMPPRAVVHPLAAAAICITSTLLGAWLGGLQGARTEHYQLTRFKGDVEAGKYLLMVDVRPARLAGVKAQMASLPQAVLLATEQTWVRPFARA